MTSQLWNQNSISDLKESMKVTTEVDELVEIMRDDFQHYWVTKESIFEAMKRFDSLSNQSAMLAPDSEDPKSFSVDSDGYQVKFAELNFYLSESDLQHMTVMYAAKKHGGMSKTMLEVLSAKIADGALPADCPKAALSYIFRSIGQTKSSPPETPIQQRTMSVLETDESNRNVRNALRQSTAGRELQKKNFEKTIRDLESDLNFYTNVTAYCERGVEVEAYKSRVPSVERPATNTLILNLADLHVGSKYKAGTMQRQRQHFDSEVFWQRIELYCHYVGVIAARMGHRIGHVHFAALGDNYEALLANMRNGQWLDMELFGSDQFDQGVKAFVKIARCVIDNFPRSTIDFVFQPGNHDRVTKDRSFNSENLITAMLAKQVKLHLSNDGLLTADRRVIFVARTMSVLLPNGVCLITRHGHRGGSGRNAAAHLLKVDKTHRIPGAKRTIQMQGHYHNFNVGMFDDIMGMTVPSFCGNQEYNIDDLNLASPPLFLAIESGEHSDSFIGPWNLLETAV